MDFNTSNALPSTLLMHNLEKGKQMGLEESKRETARRLFAKGMNIELVAELVGLPLEAIQALV